MINREQLAESLYQAEKNRAPIESLSKMHPQLALEDAYAIQDLNARRAIEHGRKLVGYKVGLTSLSAQKHFGLNHPDYGHLFSDMVVADRGTLALSELIQPKIEGEVAIVLGSDLKGPGVTFEQAVKAVAYYQAAMEIIDSRILNWKITGPDTISDNGSSARLVLGKEKGRLNQQDLPHLGMALAKDGEVTITAAGAAVLGNPVHALVFLANELGKHGKTLRAGQVILTGSLGGMLPMQKGEHFACDFAMLGRVEVRGQ